MTGRLGCELRMTRTLSCQLLMTRRLGGELRMTRRLGCELRMTRRLGGELRMTRRLGSYLHVTGCYSAQRSVGMILTYISSWEWNMSIAAAFFPLTMQVHVDVWERDRPKMVHLWSFRVL